MLLIGIGYTIFLVQEHPWLFIFRCKLKSWLGIPCPSCGNSRAILQLLQGNIIGSVLINPLGMVLAAGFVYTALFLVIDMLFKKQKLFYSYLYVIGKVKHPKLYVMLFMLMLMNWFWNIQKGL